MFVLKYNIMRKEVITINDLNTLLEIYIIYNISFFVFTILIMIKASRDLFKKREFIFFRTFTFTFLVYLIANTFWTINEYQLFIMPDWLFKIVSSISLLSVVFLSFCFFSFIIEYYKYYNHKKIITDILGVIPIIVIVILLIVSAFNGIVFSVEAHHLVRGDVYNLLMGVAFVYFLLIIILSIIKAIKSKSHKDRKMSIGFTLALIMLSAWVILDNYFERITILPIGIFGFLFYFFVSMQESNVYTDALTGMNNRRKAIEFISSQLENVTDANPLYWFLCDINSFKYINDNFGHDEGDEALIIFSTALKQLAGMHQGFAARFGGDEFVFVFRLMTSKVSPEGIKKDFEEILKNLCKDNEKKYVLSASIGIIKCADRTKTFNEYYKEADLALYREKNAFHGIL